MIGTIGLHDLRVDCIVGIHPHERETPQAVFVDLELDYDFGPAAVSDAIGDAVDYTALTALVAALLQERRFQLLEAMAEAAATEVLGHDAHVAAVRLEIRKPAAVPGAANSFVRISRVRPV
jgi:dihydroneopterin aldolase